MPASPLVRGEEIEQLPARVVLLHDPVADVGPVEGADELARVLPAAAARRSRARVGASAVAVSAMRGTCGQRSCSTSSSRYSGRKSWPHCDTQCASSIANSASWQRSSSDRKRAREQALGRDVEQVELAARAARARPRRPPARHERRVQERRAHAELRAAPRPGPASARSAARPRWRCRRAAAPASGSTATCRRRSASAPGVAAGDDVLDDLRLLAAEGRVAEDAAEDCRGRGSCTRFVSNRRHESRQDTQPGRDSIPQMSEGIRSDATFSSCNSRACRGRRRRRLVSISIHAPIFAEPKSRRRRARWTAAGVR